MSTAPTATTAENANLTDGFHVLVQSLLKKDRKSVV